MANDQRDALAHDMAAASPHLPLFLMVEAAIN
jgi:hypothetical protein